MRTNRRGFLTLAAAGLAGAVLSSSTSTHAAAGARLKAVAFDAFPVFDLRPVFGLVEQLFPQRGRELGMVWRTRLFEYQWLRALSARYADFLQVADDSLAFAAESLTIDVTRDQRAELVQSFLRLTPWPEAPAALRSLRNMGLRLAFLSNATPSMLTNGIVNGGLEDVFEHVLSTDPLRTYKPDPRAYRMATDAFGLDAGEVLFVAFAGWDVAGARWFGYPTYWVNRLDAPAERLGEPADGSGTTLSDLLGFIRQLRDKPDQLGGTTVTTTR